MEIISGKKKGDDSTLDISLALRERLATMVPKIISDAAVRSHAIGFALSSSQTEAEQLRKGRTVQQMSRLCPGFIAPAVLPFSRVPRLSRCG